MNLVHSSRNRLIALIVASTLTVGAAIPLMAMSQSPEASPANEGDLIAQGQDIYTHVCIACHQPDGNGISGIYPQLNGNPLVTGDDPTYVITTVLNGRGGMPRFNTQFSDEEIAAVVSYVRQEWDNSAAPVTADQVSDVRASVSGTPAASPTPVGQEPGGNTGSPESSPAATP